MNKMLVGISYADDGSRVISSIMYDADVSDYTFKIKSEIYKTIFDEAYVTDFDPSHIDFINEIVAKGCRL